MSTALTPAAAPHRGPRFTERLNPVTPLAATVLYSTPLLVTLDWVSAACGLIVTAMLTIALRLSPLSVVRRIWPLIIAAPISATSMLLYAKPSGRIHVEFLAAVISDGSIEFAIAVGLRVIAIGAPLILMATEIDATRLADSLAQVCRLPSRFVLGALAGMRMIAVVQDDWAELERARRARGLGDSRAIARLFSMSFALLVLAIRRGGQLATAMEARAFGGAERTWARPSRMRTADWVFMALALLAGLACIGIAIWAGTFRVIGSAT